MAKSPTLAAAMKQSEVRCLPEVKMVFPEFKKRSLIMLLQFLYTGEVGKQTSLSKKSIKEISQVTNSFFRSDIGESAVGRVSRIVQDLET